MTKKRRAGRPRGTEKNNEHLYLEKDELKKFFGRIREAGDEKYHLVFQLILYFGMRVSELCKMKIVDITVGEKMTVTIQALKKGNLRTYGNLHPELARQLKKWLGGRQDKNPYLFPSLAVKDNRPLNTQSVKNQFKRYILAAGLDRKFSVHNLRASRAVMMIKEGKYGIMELARWLRIKSVRNAQVYFDRVGYEETEGKVNRDFGVF